MNKGGQVLIMFILLIPLFILVGAFIIDTGIVLKEKSNLKSNTKTIIKEIIKDEEYSEEKIRTLYEKNNIDIANLKINWRSNELTIENEYEIDSMFGSIIGINSYNIKIDITGYEKNGKILFK